MTVPQIICRPSAASQVHCSTAVQNRSAECAVHCASQRGCCCSCCCLDTELIHSSQFVKPHNINGRLCRTAYCTHKATQPHAAVTAPKSQVGTSCRRCSTTDGCCVWQHTMMNPNCHSNHTKPSSWHRPLTPQLTTPAQRCCWLAAAAANIHSSSTISAAGSRAHCFCPGICSAPAADFFLPLLLMPAGW